MASPRLDFDDDLTSSAEAFRLLVMTPYPLRLESPHGGRVTAALTLRLAERHRIALVCLRDRRAPGTDAGSVEHARRWKRSRGRSGARRRAGTGASCSSES